MRLPGAVGIDFRDRRGVRRGASEILTSLMLVYVANLGMDYVVCGPGAIAGPATHRSSSSAMSRARLERLIEQGDVPFITQPAARASDLDQIAGHAQGIMLRRVPRYARSIGAMKAANSIVADRKRTKAFQMPKIVNLALQGDGGHGAFTSGAFGGLCSFLGLCRRRCAPSSTMACDDRCRQISRVDALKTETHLSVSSRRQDWLRD